MDAYNRRILLWTILVWFQCFGFSCCIRMLSVEVPRYEVVEGSAKLYCNYDLEDDNLYSVKWYKDGAEFYRFVPKDNPPSQVFDVPHVKVDRKASDAKEVILRHLVLGSGGYYACEASTEAPRFSTVNGEGQMDMIRLPDSKPQLRGHDPIGYKIGQWLDMNCSSPNSAPPAQLNWYVNNVRVADSQLYPTPPVKNKDGLYTPTLRLKLKLHRRHFTREGSVEVRCTATIYSQYYQSATLYLNGIGLDEFALESRRTSNRAFSSSPLQLSLILHSIVVSLFLPHHIN